MASPFSHLSWGNPENVPVVFLHGFPGSKLQGQFLAPLAESLGLYILAFDRPGYAESRPVANVAAFFDHFEQWRRLLGINRFYLIGISGGAPWAHALASRFSSDVLGLLIVSGLCTFRAETREMFSPFQRRGLSVRKVVPQALARLIVDRAMLKFSPEDLLSRYLGWLEDSDRETLARPEVRAQLIESMYQARRQGSRGVVCDSGFYAQDWLSKHCDLSRLSSLRLKYVHGSHDRLLSHRMSEYMASQIPNAKLEIVAGEGHYSLAVRHAERLVRESL